MSLAYLAGLLLATLGVGAIDARWRLALFREPLRAIGAVGATAAVLLIIDLAGIATGNFRLGASPWMTGLEVLPHLPIEELGFIVFLAYVSLVALAGAERILDRRAEAAA
jgi:lycopene cyclase domain-containing protein